jgi:hypothetical protein
VLIVNEVLFDKNGDVRTMIEKAKEWEKKEFQRPNKNEIEFTKYSLWDHKDNLEEVFESGSGDFYLAYYNYLGGILESYPKFLGYPQLRINKATHFLTSPKYRKKYRMYEFPDKRFVKLFTDALQMKKKAEMLDKHREITAYVVKEMGGFDIDGWKLRSKVER